MKLNNFILVFIFLIISFNFIYSASACWGYIECGGNRTESSTIFHTDYAEENGEKEILCKLIEIQTEEPREFEIEIVQGQFEGGEKKWSVYIDRNYLNYPFDVSFILSKATSPTYVLCHKTSPSKGTTQNPIRTATRNYWMASFDQQWFKQNAGMPEYARYNDLKNWNENKTYNNADRNSLNISQKGTQETTYTNLTADTDNWFMYGIALFLFVIGLLIIFNTVTGYTKRR